MKNIVAVIRASKGKIALAVYVNDKRIDINPKTFLERNGIKNAKTTGPTSTLWVDYPGFSQYASAYQGIIDTMRYLMPFTEKGYSVHLLTNQKVVTNQLKGTVKINKPELDEFRKVIVSLQNGKFSLQAIDPERIKLGVA